MKISELTIMRKVEMLVGFSCLLDRAARKAIGHVAKYHTFLLNLRY